MVSFPTAATLSGEATFSGQVVLEGSRPDPGQRDAPGRLWVEVDGIADCLHFYGCRAGPDGVRPLVFLEGDCLVLRNNVRAVYDGYESQSPQSVQKEAEQLALAMDRPFIILARPGVAGSSGHHLQRRRPREVALVDAALTMLKSAFGWDRFDLAGLSGGGHLVAALIARRADIDCAVIASGNVSVAQRNRAFGRDTDVTGYADFVDPIALVADVARHPPRRVIALTDPEDMVVSAAVQTAYVEALREAGVAVSQRFVTALEPTRHILRLAALMAAAAAGAGSPG